MTYYVLNLFFVFTCNAPMAFL